MKLVKLCTIILLAAALLGCDGKLLGRRSGVPRVVRKAEQAKVVKAVQPAVKDVRLAEIILRQKPSKISVNSDPFAPLLQAGPAASVAQQAAPVKTAAVAVVKKEENPLSGWRYLGMIKINGNVSALVQTPKGKEVFRLRTQVEQLVLVGIGPDAITFKNESKEFILKRGVM